MAVCGLQLKKQCTRIAFTEPSGTPKETRYDQGVEASLNNNKKIAYFLDIIHYYFTMLEVLTFHC